MWGEWIRTCMHACVCLRLIGSGDCVVIQDWVEECVCAWGMIIIRWRAGVCVRARLGLVCVCMGSWG